MLQVWLNTFLHDSKVHAIIALWVLDFVLGLASALKPPVTFRMSYIGDTLRRDGLGKVLPYFALYVMALVAGNEDVLIPNLDFGLLAGTAWVVTVAAFSGSILNSFKELFPKLPFPAFLAADEHPDTTGDAPVTIQPVGGER